MEFEERNPKPEEPKSGLPIMVLFILIGIICLLLYAGWHLMSDDASKVTDLQESSSNVLPESASIPSQNEESLEPNASVSPEDISVPEVKTKSTTEETVKETQKDQEEKPKIATPKISGESYTHTVGNNETFFGIGNKYNVSASTLQKLNPGIEPNGIKVGVTKLQVPIMARHTVGPGDILKVVASKYGVTVEALMAANGKKKNFAERGEVLIIPNKVKK